MSLPENVRSAGVSPAGAWASCPRYAPRYAPNRLTMSQDGHIITVCGTWVIGDNAGPVNGGMNP